MVVIIFIRVVVVKMKQLIQNQFTLSSISNYPVQNLTPPMAIIIPTIRQCKEPPPNHSLVVDSFVDLAPSLSAAVLTKFEGVSLVHLSECRSCGVAMKTAYRLECCCLTDANVFRMLLRSSAVNSSSKSTIMGACRKSNRERKPRNLRAKKNQPINQQSCARVCACVSERRRSYSPCKPNEVICRWLIRRRASEQMAHQQLDTFYSEMPTEHVCMQPSQCQPAPFATGSIKETTNSNTDDSQHATQ